MVDQYEKLKLENQLCFSLYAASREVIKLYRPFLDKYNLTYTQYIIMLVLWEEKKITVKQLGEKLHLDSGTLTPVLKKLEAMHLIIKYRDKQDDRVVVAELTEKAITLRDEVLEVPEQIYCRLNSGLEDLMELKKLLDTTLTRLS